jgi:hypothetical protein
LGTVGALTGSALLGFLWLWDGPIGLSLESPLVEHDLKSGCTALVLDRHNKRTLAETCPAWFQVEL